MRNILKANVRKKINTKLRKISSELYNLIPLSDIEDILEDNGYHLVQEDGTRWSGFLCGDDSYTYFDMADNNDKIVTNCKLTLSWYKYSTGRYEIVTYLA